MAIPSIADVLKIFDLVSSRRLTKKQTKIDAVIEWLQSVQDDARNLRETWIQINRMTRVEDVELGMFIETQVYYNAHFEEFYATLTEVIGKNIGPEFHQEIINRMAQVMISRNQMRQRLDHYLDPAFDNIFNRFAPPHQRAALESLNRDIASLDVLIENFKATAKLH